MITAVNMFNCGIGQSNGEKSSNPTSQKSGFADLLLGVNDSTKDLDIDTKSEKLNKLSSDIEESLVALGYIANIIGTSLPETVQLIKQNTEKVKNDSSLSSVNEIMQKIVNCIGDVEKIVSNVTNQKPLFAEQETGKISIDGFTLTDKQSDKLTDICAKLLNSNNEDFPNVLQVKSMVSNELSNYDVERNTQMPYVFKVNSYPKISYSNSTKSNEPILESAKTFQPITKVDNAVDSLQIEEIKTKSNKIDLVLPIIQSLQETGILKKAITKENINSTDFQVKPLINGNHQKTVLRFENMQGGYNLANYELPQAVNRQNKADKEPISFDDNLTKLISKPEQQPLNQVLNVKEPSPLGSNNIEETVKMQVIDKFMLMSKQGNKEITMTLNPENLGKLSLKVSSDKDGIKASIITNNIQVKDVISNQSVGLLDLLRDQGVKVNSFEVQYKGNDEGWNLFSGSGQNGQQFKPNQQRKYENFKQYNEESAISTFVSEMPMTNPIGFDYLA